MRIIKINKDDSRAVRMTTVRAEICYPQKLNVETRRDENAKDHICKTPPVLTTITLQALCTPLEHSGNYTYHVLTDSQTLHFIHTVYLCVQYDSHNKQQSFDVYWTLHYLDN